MNPAIREFLRAAADGDIGRVRALLVQGAEVNSTNAAGQTALILATAFQHVEVVELLLKANADVEHQDELGLTAIDWAKPAPHILELLEAPPIPVIQPEPNPVIESPEFSGNTSTTAPNLFASPAVVEAPPSIQAPLVESSIEPPIETATPPIHRLRIPPSPLERTGEEPALKGLAAAILRDHKPRHADPVFDIAAPEAEIPETTPDATINEPTAYEATPIIESDSEAHLETNDDTLGGPVETNDDTLARKARPLSSSRIFDLGEPEESPRPLSKVQVSVPQHTNGSRNGVLVWLLVILVLAGGGYGGYRLASSLLTKQTEAANSPPPTTTVDQPKVEVSKRAPVVNGDFSGAELYLPDAKYPSGATVQDGTVTVEVRVSKKGIVVGAKAIEGDESLKGAAEEAAKSSAFSPDKLEDKPALMSGTITYHFNSSFRTPALSAPVSNGEKVTATLGGPLAGTELKLVQPRKPSSFKDSDGEDTVTIVVRVNRLGRVVSWRPLEGAQELRTAAVQAAKQSTFSPDKLPDTGDVVGTITYNFH